MFRYFNRFISHLKNDILQQKIRGRFIPRTFTHHSFLLFLLSVTSLVLGCIITYTYYNLFDIQINYNESGTIPIFLPASTIYFYIQIDDFYQSNLKYSKSISYDQLKGERETNSSGTSPLDSRNGRDYYPAGILPNTFFQDFFEFEGLNIKTDKIAWDSMRRKMKQSGYTRNEVIPPPLWENYTEIPDLSKNERFINWIYTAPYQNFRKLWGVVNVRESGTYNLNIISTYPYGTKSVYLTQMSWVGTKNYFLSLCMIIIGLIGIIFSFLLYKKIIN